MKHIENTIIALSSAFALLLATACNKIDFVPEGIKNMGFDAQVVSTPMSEDDVQTKTQPGNSPAPECFLTDESGTISLPVTCEVMDAVDAPATKGTLINYNDNPDYQDNALSGYLTEFKAYAYKGTEVFFTKATGNCETVTYSSSKWSSANTYKWPEDTELQILAYANAPSDNISILCTKIDGKMAERFEYSIPEKASDQNDILLGAYIGKGDRSVTDVATAPIEFQHPLTCVRIKIASSELAKLGAIKKISLIGVMEKYSYTLKYDGTGDGSAFSGSGYNRTVYQDKAGGLDIDTNGYIGVPFIIAPQNIESYPVSLKVETVSGMTLYASLSVVGNNLAAGKVNVFNIGYDNNVYVFNLLGDSDVLTFKNTTKSETQSVKLVSYRHPLGDSSDSQPVAFKAEYSLNDGATWTLIDNTPFASLSGFFEENDGCVTPTDYSLIASARTTYIPDPDSHFKWEDEAYGSMLDLSTVDANGDAVAGGANSANCYVIHHPGEYKFPLVYGNALQNGSINSSSYHTSNTGEHILSTFLNCYGEEIKSGYILTDLSLNGHTINPKACLLWQDAWEGKIGTNPGVGFITEVGIDGNYITFKTATGTNLLESNAMIALYDENGSNNQYDEGVDQILWSWHIWASEAGFSTSFCTKSSNGFEFAPVNVGFCKGRKVIYKVDQDDYKQVFVRLTQLQGHAAPIIIMISQPDVAGVRPADCSLFQTWRKDPIRSAIKGGVKDCYTFDGTIIPKTASLDIPTGFTVAEALATEISHPDRMIKYPGSNKVLDIYNLWSMSNENRNSKDINEDNMKTIYDPSPVGFKVPAWQAFSEFDVDKVYADARPDMEVSVFGEVEFYYAYYFYNWSVSSMSNSPYLTASVFESLHMLACPLFQPRSKNISVGYGVQSAYPLLPVRDIVL